MLDYNGYPDDKSLEEIENFDLMKPRCLERLPEFVKLIYDNWNYADFHGIRYCKEGGMLELHTFGWSGNEDVINSVKKSKSLFWGFFWEISTRGGHYWFKLYQFDQDGKIKSPELNFIKNGG